MSEAVGQPSQSVNPNTAVDTSETITAGTGSITSFDEIESVNKGHKESLARQAKDEKVKEEIKEEKPSKEAKAEKPKDGKQVKPEEKQSKEEKKALKMLKAKLEGKDIELHPEAMVTVTVDGEKMEVPLHELSNGYAGQKAISKRFNEISSQKKEFESSRKDFESRKYLVDKAINEIGELSKTNPYLAIKKAFEVVGGDHDSFIESIRKAETERLNKILSMTPEERRAFEAEEKAGLFEQQLRHEREQSERLQGQRKLESEIVAIQRELDIPEEEFERYTDELLELKKAGKITTQITPRFIAQVIQDDRMYKTASEATEAIRPDFPEDRKQVLTNALVDVLRKEPKLPKEALIEIAEEAFGIKAASKSVSKRIEKNEDKPRSTINPAKESLWQFDQV